MKQITQKTCTIKTLCAILCGLFLATSCVEPEEPIKPKPPIDNPTNYPIDIPFTEYIFTIFWNWRDINYNNKVLIINNKEELEKYIWRAPSNIDFSKYTLLVANGSVNSGLIKTTLKDLQQLSPNDYQLAVETVVFESTVSENWAKALFVEKLSDESNVELHITEEQWPIGLELGYYREAYPISGWSWIRFENNRERVQFVKSGPLLDGVEVGYEIFKDSIKLQGIYGNTTMHYLRMINSTKFEIELPDPKNPEFTILSVFERRE
jgi:hypothetical protein